MQASAERQLEPRERILRAAADILAEHGREAVTTRNVSATAAVQPPTIYRHFGDMRQLIDDAASLGMAEYLAAKRRQPRTNDPVEDLRGGWNRHVDFGLANPTTYAVLYGDPRPDAVPRAVAEGDAILEGMMQRIAQAGRLRVSVGRAADMVHSACRGVTLTLISQPPDARDPELSNATREALLAAITTDGSDGPLEDARTAARAIALKSVLKTVDASVLTEAETALLVEWLDRLSR
ncbi:TetR/AcrR family transcriptional regulator [Mycolicibacterium elephantis]|uniref:TetR/AcrR family transcriptional regulator n=1 Tax=Mycolicibacterium elephantis TaxID=81858 RepID=UPI0007EA3982|nr:TetR/AcrR family transcriptional regulator [Mycolicibacterium elephantis]OBB19854.1 TetR family transcriptional regulator [Mycolicibacterium elephantis]